jgi:dihydropyrimidinase
MDGFDLVIRGGTVATACETMNADIGIRDGRVVALGQAWPRARRDRCERSAGVARRRRCALPPRPADGRRLRMADDFRSGTRSAACGGTTTVIPFAAQQRGQSLRAAVDDYHARAEARRPSTTRST